jgi:hypothetical protein
MRTVLRLLTVLLAISLIGSLPMRVESCEPTAAPCHDAQSRSMDCCRTTHCHCDVSAPSQPVPNPMPVRTTTMTGRDMVKIASMPMAVAFLSHGEHFVPRSTARADASLSAIATPYLLTHAFLI